MQTAPLLRITYNLASSPVATTSAVTASALGNAAALSLGLTSTPGEELCPLFTFLVSNPLELTILTLYESSDMVSP